MKQIFLTLTIFTFLVLPCLAQQSKAISDADYAEVIKLVLSDQRLGKRSFLPSKEQRTARLSIENIKPNLIPGKIDGVKTETRSAQQTQEDKKSGRRYYAFGKFDFNDSRVTVVFFYYQ